MSQKTKNIILTSLKAVVSAGLIYFIITRIDLEKFIANISNFPLWALPIVAVAFCATVLIGGWRWKIFIRPFGKISYWRLVALYYVGYFFNNFLPSGVGGDVVRGYISGKELDNMAGAYSTILAERVSGILATVFLSLVALPFIKFNSQIFFASISLNIGLWTGVLLFLLLPSEKIFEKYFRWLPFNLGEKLKNFATTLRSYRSTPKILISGFFASVLYQGSIILVVALAGYFAGAKLPLPFYFATVPLVWVISLIPISLNAIGVREASFAYFFDLYGAGKSTGFLVSIVVFGISVAAGILGGIIFAFWNSTQKKRPASVRLK
ncbi:flippase-like domain-containing protein [bacterium]|nr:flippase-like domain-containing protein [bacterium]